MGYKAGIPSAQTGGITTYYLNYVGYKVLLAIKGWKSGLQEYYLNYVGYKEVSDTDIVSSIILYYLNYVGYKGKKIQDLG